MEARDTDAPRVPREPTAAGVRLTPQAALDCGPSQGTWLAAGTTSPWLPLGTTWVESWRETSEPPWRCLLDRAWRPGSRGCTPTPPFPPRPSSPMLPLIPHAPARPRTLSLICTGGAAGAGARRGRPPRRARPPALRQPQRQVHGQGGVGAEEDDEPPPVSEGLGGGRGAGSWGAGSRQC